MHSFLNQEIEKVIIDESLINSISWVNEFKDIIVDIDWCGREDFEQEIDFNYVKTSLYFKFVTDAEFNCKFKADTMGPLEITTFSFSRNDDIWSINFKFHFHSVGYSNSIATI